MAKRTIVVVGEGIRREYTAGGAITPGDLLVVTSSETVTRHATATQRTEPLFAIENEVFGRGVDVDYATNDRVLCEICDDGMSVNCTIAASAAAIVIGDMLESAGDGTLRKTTTAANAIARAEEAIDNSGGASKVRIRARLY